MNKMLSSVALLAIASNVLMAGGDIAPVEPAVPEVVVNDSWKYTASINLWMAGIEATTIDGAQLDIGFSDILDNLDMTFMGTIGAEKGKWGLLTDIIYLNISDDVNVPIPGNPGLEVTSIEMKNWIVTPMVTYKVMESEQLGLNVLAGARYLYLKSPIDVNYTPLPIDSDSMWDGIIGVRGKYDLNEKWYMPFHVDVGTGDSDVTWQAFVGVGYKYESWDLLAGYRYMNWEFEDSDPAAGALTDLTVDGPIIGAKFYF